MEKSRISTLIIETLAEFLIFTYPGRYTVIYGMCRDRHVQNRRFFKINFSSYENVFSTYFLALFQKISSKNFFGHLSRVKNDFFG